MIYLLNKISQMPFPTTKDAVIMARGERNRDRFLWNLDRVNVFYLNSQPVQWALDYYQKQYPQVWEQSIFAFLHADHTRDLQAIQDFKIDIITWEPGTMKKLKTNNCSTAACDFLSKNLADRNIYLCAFDFVACYEWMYRKEGDRRTWFLGQRDFTQEARHLRTIIRPGAYRNRWYFVTPCPAMFDFYPKRLSYTVKATLLKEGTISRELTAREVKKEYCRAGIMPPPEPGVIMRINFNPHICHTCIHLDPKAIVMRQTKPGSSHYCQKNHELIAEDKLSEERECWE